jgi:hypothetical protein
LLFVGPYATSRRRRFGHCNPVNSQPRIECIANHAAIFANIARIDNTPVIGFGIVDHGCLSEG